MFLNNSPRDRCEQIFFLVKNSNLNFNAQETPFSLNIQIKKKFVNRWETGHPSANFASFYSQDLFSNASNRSTNIQENTVEGTTKEENKQLKEEISKLRAEKETQKNVINILEDKLAKAEAELFKECENMKKSLEEKK